MSTVFTQIPYPYTLGIRTNACTNPSFEASNAGWSQTGAGSPTIQRRVAGQVAVGGAYCCRIATTAAGTGSVVLNGPTLSVLAGQIWPVSAYVRGTAGRSAFAGAFSGAAFTGTSVTLSSSWQRVDYSIVIPAAQTAMFPLVAFTAVSSGDYMDVDGVLVEQAGSVAPPSAYFDGSSSPGPSSWARWTGTPDLSSSEWVIQTPIAAEANTYTTDSVMAWEETNTRRVTEHAIIGQPDPIVTVSSAPRSMDTRRGTFETFHTTEADARAFVQFLYAQAVMVADPQRLTLPPYIVIRDAAASPFGDEKRRWSVRASWTEVNPAGLGL